MDKTQKTRSGPKYMGYEFIFAGLLFLFNPNFGVLDIFPDVIGYALMLYGLYRLRDMASELETAANLTLKLLWLSAVRVLLMVLVPQMEDAGYSLVFTFVFCVFETILAMMMFSHLFAGYTYVGLRNGGEKTVSGKRFGDYRALTNVFLVIRAAFNLIPELRHLSTSDYTGVVTSTGIFDLQNYKSFLYFSDGIVAGAFGIAWLVMTILYYRGIFAEKSYIENLRSYYATDIEVNTKLFDYRYISLATIFTGIGFGCSCDIFLDGKNYIPDFLLPLLLYIGLRILGERFISTKKLRLLCIPAFVVSLAMWIYSFVFSKYYTYNVFKKFEATYLFLGMLALAVVESVVVVLLILGVRRILSHLVRNYCGVEDDERFKKLTEEKNLMLGSLRRQLNAFTALGIITAVSSVANYFYMFVWSEYWMINSVIQIAFLFTIVRIFTSVADQVKVRYKNL